MRIKSILFILFFINSIFAGFFIKEFEFEEKALKIEKIDGYDRIYLEGCDDFTLEPGYPLIPFKNINILIPPSAEITSIEILELEKKEIVGNYYLYPVQEPRPISEMDKEFPFTPPNPEIYESKEEYPKELYKIIKSGSKSGFRIGGIFLFPLHYIPFERRLILYTKIRIKVNYEEGKYEIISLTRGQMDLFKEDVKHLVINPKDIDRFSPLIRYTENFDIDYVILTDINLVSSFIPLRDWLRKTGYWTEIRTTQWVNANFPGRDLQERIRNFIRNYFQTEGLKYVLLGGDGDWNNPVVPTRQAYMAGEYGGHIACDLYYADLDWSWDGDRDNRFGERADTVDLYHDVYIGRIPVETPSHVNNFISKLFRYLKTPDTTYQKRLLLPAAFLGVGWNHMESQDSIAALSPAGWTDRVINQDRNIALYSQVRDSINQKFHFVHLVAHGNAAGTWIRAPHYPQYHRDYTGIQINTNALCIINAISCHPGAFDSTVSPSCLAESALNAPNAAIGVIMNTRYGWEESGKLNIIFYNHFFIRDSIRFSPCHQSSKERYRNQALEWWTWRYCYYTLTLFGEPSMMMWRDYPKRMVAHFRRLIFTGYQVFICTVKTTEGTPLSNVLVSLWKGDEVYQRGYTNALGVVSLNIIIPTAGYMYITCTRPNYIPYEDSSRVIGTVPSITYDVGVTRIRQPTDTVYSGRTIIPQARVQNFGTHPASFRAVFRIGNFYTDTISYSNLLSSNSVILSFSPWTTQRGRYLVSCTVIMVNDQIPENNLLTDSVKVKFAQQPGWNRWDSLPAIIPPIRIPPVASGGALCALGDKVYALVGNNTSHLMIYDINTRTWSRDTVPLGSRRTRVRRGASICTDSQYIYVVKGGNTKEFWRYDPATKIWREYSIPFARGITGSSMAFDGDTFIYIICGSNNNEWIRFNIHTERFETCVPATLPAGRWRVGSWIVYVNDTIYALNVVSGGSAILWIIPIGGTPYWRSWMPPFPDPGEGSAGAYNPDNGLIYAFKGNNTKAFFSYNPVTHIWTTLESLPGRRGVRGGGALTYSAEAGGLFAFRGNNTREFWFYSPRAREGTFLASASPSFDGIQTAETKTIKDFIFKVIQEREHLKISYTLPIKAKATINMYNILGEVVYRASSDNGEFIINTKNFASGIYIIRFNANEFKATEKIVIY